MNKSQALSLEVNQWIYHVKLRNQDESPVRARVIGKPQTWRNDPERWLVSMRQGQNLFNLKPTNADYWTLHSPTPMESRPNVSKNRSFFASKHYRMVAATLRNQHPDRDPKPGQTHYGQWANTVRAIAAMFEQDNSQFNRSNFFNLVGLDF